MSAEPATATAVPPGSLHAWWLAIRPRTLTAGLVPVAIGTALAAADGSWYLGLALLCTIVALGVQIATNLVNDYSDFKRGADADRVGPLRVSQAGLLCPIAVRNAAVFSLAVTVVAGIPIVMVGGWPFLVAGVFAVAAAVLYTAGPAPLGYIGLGDLFVFVFFGLVATVGTFAVQTGKITAASVLLAIASGLFAVALLAVNNQRDIDTDRAAGKCTLAVRIGRRATKIQIVACCLGAFALTVVSGALGLTTPLVIVSLVAIVLCIPAARAVVADDGSHPAALIPALGSIARTQLAWGVLVTGALIVGVFLA